MKVLVAIKRTIDANVKHGGQGMVVHVNQDEFFKMLDEPIGGGDAGGGPQ